MNPERFAQAIEALRRVREQVLHAVVGQDDTVDTVLAALLAGGHVLLEGVPGLGKTLLVRALAKTFSGQFSRVQFTPDLMPADVTGHALFDLKNQDFIVRHGPIFANLVLADEINRAPAKTQAALLEAMQERQVTIEGETHALPAPFMVLATQNPIDQEGTYPLPEAQLDRFLVKVLIDYPAAADEVALVRQVTSGQVGDALDLSTVGTLLRPETINALQQITAEITVDDQVLDYAVRIVRATRDWPGLSMGASPRGAIGLVRVARALALLGERDFVTPDEIKRAALPVLRHRVMLAPESELEGLSADRLLVGLLEQLPAPRA
ncbi:hypothetical protein GCM10007860_13480 [Chitiniphilus shinanonensis]|uniref:Uncharacterized protein n=1 Tax=Chitiniphilus shinanonensis TaxID=553088 RepID=A0ABQ6BS62_9NEIS|nr:MoxR family ATPase [Chitiniphilus shinanonensis]GLS04202.1 hypothetical protein GCM10007860_13480 [Chitiniphilus shinanonensis]